MNLFNLLESPKLGAPSNTPGAQDIGDQHSPSPIGSGTSKRESKKKPVTMMGVGVCESKIIEVWEPLTEAQVPNFLDDDFYAYDPETKEIKGTWSHKSVGRRHSEHQAQQMGWQVVSGMRARSLGLHYPDKGVAEAGPFSYGAKKPRKGSVADLAAKKRKEQERGKQPIEPKDQMVGTARVIKDVTEGSAQDKLHKRHQELRKKSGLPNPDYYKELKATYDLPDEERYAKAAELKKKYDVKEDILDRAAPKMPKPRNPAEKILTAKRTSGAAGKHVNKKRQSQLQPKHRDRDELEEGWKSALGGAALAGAMALGAPGAQAGDLEQQIGPLPVMATIVIKAPDGSTKTIKKDLGHSYDYKIDDAKKDIENLLIKKGIQNFTIHLDRYNDNSAYLDRDAMSKSQAPDYRAKTDYVDNKPYEPKGGKGDYMDKTPYKASPTKVNYLDKAKSGEFRDMANYESRVNEMDRRGFLKGLGAAALAGAGVSAAAQQMDTMARVIMIVNGEQVERVINLGQVSSPQAAERQLANELRSRGIDQFQIQLERGAPPQTAPVNTRPRPYGARSVSGPGGVVDTAGQVAGDIEGGNWRGAAEKTYKTYQQNKNADLGAVGRGELKDRIIKGVVGGLGLDEDLNEEFDKHLYQLQKAGYDIITEEASLCPECGGVSYSNKLLAEKQDACYSKVKSRYKVWPSAYASGALVRCRKVGAKNWGNKSKK